MNTTAFDLAKLEALLVANDLYSGFPVGQTPVLAAFDLHKQAAAEMFNVPVEQVTTEQRQAAKARNYLLCYGGK